MGRRRTMRCSDDCHKRLLRSSLRRKQRCGARAGGARAPPPPGRPRQPPTQEVARARLKRPFPRAIARRHTRRWPPAPQQETGQGTYTCASSAVFTPGSRARQPPDLGAVLIAPFLFADGSRQVAEDGRQGLQPDGWQGHHEEVQRRTSHQSPLAPAPRPNADLVTDVSIRFWCLRQEKEGRPQDDLHGRQAAAEHSEAPGG